jgi:hypothetical protein
MSDETYANLQAAINAHVLSELDPEEELELPMVRDWVVIASIVDVSDLDSDTALVTMHRSLGCQVYAAIGLLEIARESIG